MPDLWPGRRMLVFVSIPALVAGGTLYVDLWPGFEVSFNAGPVVRSLHVSCGIEVLFSLFCGQIRER